MKDVDGDVKRDICAGFYLFNANFPQLSEAWCASASLGWLLHRWHISGVRLRNFTAHCLAHVHRAVFVLYFRANTK